MEYISIRESNPICPALVKLSPFRIVGLARRQPCCTLTHQKNEIFPACRVEEFPQSKFFVRQGKSADNPDGLTSILTQDCGKFACGNHIVFDSLMLNPHWHIPEADRCKSAFFVPVSKNPPVLAGDTLFQTVLFRSFPEDIPQIVNRQISVPASAEYSIS